MPQKNAIKIQGKPARSLAQAQAAPDELVLSADIRLVRDRLAPPIRLGLHHRSV
jgi:hypothetical protein